MFGVAAVIFGAAVLFRRRWQRLADSPFQLTITNCADVMGFVHD